MSRTKTALHKTKIICDRKKKNKKSFNRFLSLSLPPPSVTKTEAQFWKHLGSTFALGGKQYTIMSDIESIFHSSVREAVQLTVQNNKPLFVFLALPDSITNESFLNKFVTKDAVSLLQNSTVPLKLIQGSVEFGYFEQLFQNLIVPSFYVVLQGKLKAVITNDFAREDFDKCIAELLSLNGDSTTSIAFASATSLNQAASSSSHNPPTARPTEEENSPTLLPNAAPLNTQTSQTSSLTVLDDHEQSVMRHRKIVAQQRKEKMAEKQRIRDLLEADKRERQSKEKAEKERVDDARRPSQSLAKKNDHTNCLLAIKLFDGSTIKHDFKLDDTLITVRTYLDEEVKIIPSTSSMPSFASTTYPTGYSFHRPTLPRITYSEEQESQSLLELDLTPRSILILKPTYNQTNSSNAAPGNEKVGILQSVYNFVAGIGRALYSFFDYGVDDVQRQVSLDQPLAPRQEEEVIDLHQPIAAGILSVGDRGLSSSLLNIERDERDVLIATPVESRASSPRPALSRVQTIHDDTRDPLRDTYNGNSINLRDDDQTT